MASSVGNSGFSVNQQFANQLGRGDNKTSENLRNQSGVTHTAKKSTVSKGGRVAEEGSQLSPAAREALKSEQAQHADHMAEHGNEMAHQAGLDVPTDDHEESELQRKRGFDRDQELLADGQTSADGKNIAMTSPEGTKQVMKVEDHEYLTKKMDDPDFTDEQVLGDIPPAKLEAANAVMDTQLAQGASKVAVLKTDPKIDAVAETMEIQPAPPLAEPMDIRDSSNDPKMKPLQLELPLEMHQVAAEKAAAELASGNHQEEAMIAGGIPGGQQSIDPTPSKAAPPAVSPELQEAQVETDQNARILGKLDQGPLQMNGKTVSQRDGFEAVRNNAQDRFQAAFDEMPAEAQQAVHNKMDSVKQDFHEDPTNTARYNRASPEERTQIETGWMAEASQKFAADPGVALEAVGASKDLKLDPANLKHLGDGAEHYLKAQAGVEKHSEVKAPQVSPLEQAQETTDATAAKLTDLEKKSGIGTQVSPNAWTGGGKAQIDKETAQEGFDAVRGESLDRMNDAASKLPPQAQKSIDSMAQKLESNHYWMNLRMDRDEYESKTSPEAREQMESVWKAQAAKQFADDPQTAKLGIDPATLKNLGDGSSQYLRATRGFTSMGGGRLGESDATSLNFSKESYLKPTEEANSAGATAAAGAAGAAAGAAAAAGVKGKEGATTIRTDGPFPTAEMPDKATTESLKQFSEPLAEAQLKLARSQLNPGQKADLEMLEADVASIRAIGAKMNANPNDKELWTKSQAEVAGIQARIGQTAGRYQQPGALQVTFGPPPNGEVYTHLSWHEAQVGTEVRQQGYQGMGYTLTSAAGKTDYQVTARPTDGNGQNDGTYVQYRVASDDPKSWQGVAAVVGNLQGVNGYSACTTAAGDNTLQTQLQTNPQTLTPAQQAVIKQAMGDLKTTWPAGGTPAPNAAQGPGQPQQPVAPGYIDYQRYMNQNPQMAGYYPPAWQPQQPPFMPNMGGYPNYQPYPPNNYGGMPGGGWNSWGGAGMGGMNGMYGMSNLYGMGGMGMGGYGMGMGMGGFGGGGGMNAMMGMFAVSNLISSISFPLMMFSMF